MGKWAPTEQLDAGLDYIALSDRVCVCSQQPASYAEAITTYKLAIATISGTDFSKASGDTSGRKLTFGGKTGVTVDASGTANHIAYCSAGDSKLRWVTTCTEQALTAGNTVNVPSGGVDEVAAPI